MNKNNCCDPDFLEQINTHLASIAEQLKMMNRPLAFKSPKIASQAMVWDAQKKSLEDIGTSLSALPLRLLQGIDAQKELLYANTLQFARGFSANNALLWGARGAGKSALVKAVFKAIAKDYQDLSLIEIYCEDIIHLSDLLRSL
ncbi:MAG: DUF815 domain-containing protein, partial [Pseudomonadota bacterium]